MCRPANSEDPSVLLPLPLPNKRPARRPLVLVADAEESVRHVLEVVLHVAGFETTLAASGPEALKGFLKHPRAVAVALLDVGMPGMSGPQTLAALRRFDPWLPCCFMTRDPVPYTVADLISAGAACVFWKPLAFGEVAVTLRRLTAPLRALE
jgi:two-component system response regulator PilR (NtrC family)